MRSNSFTAHTVLVLPHTCPQGKVFCLSPYHLLSHSQASFKFQHIADAVYSGVDGIGIGGAQILRYMDYETGMHGPYVCFLNPVWLSTN
jgi:hypothetical protein